MSGMRRLLVTNCTASTEFDVMLSSLTRAVQEFKVFREGLDEDVVRALQMRDFIERVRPRAGVAHAPTHQQAPVSGKLLRFRRPPPRFAFYQGEQT